MFELAPIGVDYFTLSFASQTIASTVNHHATYPPPSLHAMLIAASIHLEHHPSRDLFTIVSHHVFHVPLLRLSSTSRAP